MTSFRIVGVGAVLFILALPTLEAQQAEPRRIATAPAFDARALTSYPTKDWITNGGNVFNQRYSPLMLLDRGNVKDLKGEMASRGKVNAFSARDGKLVRKTEAISESRRWVPH